MKIKEHREYLFLTLLFMASPNFIFGQVPSLLSEKNNVQSTYDATRSLFGVDEVHGNVPKPSSFQARTFGSFSRRIKKDMSWLHGVSQRSPNLFAHWAIRAKPTVSDNKSRMTGDCHVRFRENLGAEMLGFT